MKAPPSPPKPSRRGRRSKFTEDRRKRILDALAAGNFLKTACAYGGVDDSTFNKWRQRAEKYREPEYVAFFAAVKEAETVAEVSALATIRKAANDTWFAAAWFLERKFPERWARRDRVPVDGEGREAVTAVPVVMFGGRYRDDGSVAPGYVPPMLPAGTPPKETP